MNNSLAVCPGSFDPVTLGHIDIIRRAGQIFDRVLVAVMANPAKASLFTPEERVEMLRKATRCMDNVKIAAFDGLLYEYVDEVGATAIVKGLRAVSDFDYEFQMALTNKKMNPSADTIFLTPAAERMFLSSSVVKQIGGLGGDISDFVPECVHGEIVARLQEGRK